MTKLKAATLVAVAFVVSVAVGLGTTEARDCEEEGSAGITLCCTWPSGAQEFMSNEACRNCSGSDGGIWCQEESVEKECSEKCANIKVNVWETEGIGCCNCGGS